jgi:hypothetical protein
MLTQFANDILVLIKIVDLEFVQMCPLSFCCGKKRERAEKRRKDKKKKG